MKWTVYLTILSPASEAKKGERNKCVEYQFGSGFLNKLIDLTLYEKDHSSPTNEQTNKQKTHGRCVLAVNTTPGFNWLTRPPLRALRASTPTTLISQWLPRTETKGTTRINIALVNDTHPFHPQTKRNIVHVWHIPSSSVRDKIRLRSLKKEVKKNTKKPNKNSSSSSRIHWRVEK